MKIYIFILFYILTTFIIGNDARELTWKTMANLNFETGQAPHFLQDHHNKMVEVAGFIVPLEMDESIDQVKEFMLVPDPLSCIHVPPPPPNQIIFVKMKDAIPLDMDYRGVAITGILHIVQSPNGLFGYNLSGLSAKAVEIEYEDPLFELLEL